MNNEKKRKNQETNEEQVKQKPKLDKVKTTLKSRSNTNLSNIPNRFTPNNTNSNRLSNVSSNGRLSNASSAGRLSNASSTGRLSNSSSTGRLSNSSSTGRLSNTSTTPNNTTLSKPKLIKKPRPPSTTLNTLKSPTTPPVKNLSNASGKRTLNTGAAVKSTLNSTTTKTNGVKQTITKSNKTNTVKSVTSANNRVIKKPVSKSIPSWDTKGQLKELQRKNTEIEDQIKEQEQARDEMQAQVDEKDVKLKEALEQVASIEMLIKETNEKYEKEIQEIKDKMQAENQVLIDKTDGLRLSITANETSLQTMKHSKLDTLKSIEVEKLENTTLSDRKLKIENKYTESDSKMTDKRLTKQVHDSNFKSTQETLCELEEYKNNKLKLIRETEQSLFECEIERRKIHEEYQSLKGNIRVFCRVRPPLASKDETNLVNVRYFNMEEDSGSIEFNEQVTSTLGKRTNKSYTYTFDKVFSTDSTQKECYEEISQLVQSALDGYNVCIFAYGQTGSGKTYTMQGSIEDEGMIPRTVKQIYSVIQDLKSLDWEYKMEGQFLEIYNETINDLLGDVTNYGKTKHEIYHQNGATTISNMSTVVLDSPTKVKMMLKKANQNRATASTNMNERSSRSHSVFTLKLIGYNKKLDQHTTGLLNLIDLAGSERLSMSGSTGDRLTETININKSLSCLKLVIHSLVHGGHIPYRNSKLTYLLQNSLGGNCKTLMFVNISPLMEHFNESICSLRFATEVNSCHVGTATKKFVTK